MTSYRPRDGEVVLAAYKTYIFETEAEVHDFLDAGVVDSVTRWGEGYDGRWHVEVLLYDLYDELYGELRGSQRVGRVAQ